MSEREPMIGFEYVRALDNARKKLSAARREIEELKAERDRLAERSTTQAFDKVWEQNEWRKARIVELEAELERQNGWVEQLMSDALERDTRRAQLEAALRDMLEYTDTGTRQRARNILNQEGVETRK